MSEIGGFLTAGEEIEATFQGSRDGVVFTNKRIIAIDVKGLTGARQSYLSLPYDKIQIFSVESASVIGFDNDLNIWFAGVGCIHFSFTSGTDIENVCRIIGEHTLPATDTATPKKPVESKEPEPETLCTAKADTERMYFNKPLSAYDGVCPACGTKHYKPRNSCVRCGATFIDE